MVSSLNPKYWLPVYLHLLYKVKVTARSELRSIEEEVTVV
jgi:hypothetical protein